MPPLPQFRRAYETGAEVVAQLYRDRLIGEAAKIAYFLFLSLFPLILVLFALTGILGGDAAFTWIMGQLEQVMPRAAAASVEGFVHDVTGSSRPGILSLSIVLTIWSASSCFLALGDSLDVVFKVKSSRRWWKRRALALGFVAAESLALIGGAVLLLAGPELLRLAGFGPFWTILQLPATLALVVLTLWRIYYTLPGHSRRPAPPHLMAGALTGTLLWAATTWGFRLYLAETARYKTTYGVVGGVLVLLVWLHLTAVSLLLGGEVAALLDRRAQARRGKKSAAAAPVKNAERRASRRASARQR